MSKDSGSAGLLVLPFYFNVVFLFLLVVSFPFLDRGSASYTVALMGIGLTLFSLVLFGGLIRFGWTPFWERES